MLQKQIEFIKNEIAHKQIEIKRYQNLKSDSLYQLMLMECIKAGFVPKDAMVFENMRDISIPKESDAKNIRQQNYFVQYNTYITYGRVIWIVFSLLVMIGLAVLYRMQKTK